MYGGYVRVLLNLTSCHTLVNQMTLLNFSSFFRQDILQQPTVMVTIGILLCLIVWDLIQNLLQNVTSIMVISADGLNLK